PNIHHPQLHSFPTRRSSDLGRLIDHEFRRHWLALKPNEERLTQAGPEQWKIRQSKGIASQCGCDLLGGWFGSADIFYRERSDGHAGGRFGEGKNTGDFEDSTRPGNGEICRGFDDDSVHLESSGN